MQIFLTRLSLIVTVGLQLAIMILLIRRRLQKRFYWFFVYIIYEIVESAVRLGFAGDQGMYFKVYWSTEVVDVLLSVLAVRESFLNVFWVFTRFRWFRWLIGSWIVLAVLYASWKAWAFPPLQASRLVSGIIALESALDYSVGVIGVLYFLLVGILKIKNHQWESAVIMGFTINVGLAMFGFVARSVFGTKFQVFSEWLIGVAYLVAEITWLVLLMRRERVLPTVALTAEEMISRLVQYRKVLEKVLGR